MAHDDYEKLGKQFADWISQADELSAADEVDPLEAKRLLVAARRRRQRRKNTETPLRFSWTPIVATGAAVCFIFLILHSYPFDTKQAQVDSLSKTGAPPVLVGNERKADPLDNEKQEPVKLEGWKIKPKPSSDAIRKGKIVTKPAETNSHEKQIVGNKKEVARLADLTPKPLAPGSGSDNRQNEDEQQPGKNKKESTKLAEVAAIPAAAQVYTDSDQNVSEYERQKSRALSGKCADIVEKLTEKFESKISDTDKKYRLLHLYCLKQLKKDDLYKIQANTFFSRYPKTTKLDLP